MIESKLKMHDIPKKEIDSSDYILKEIIPRLPNVSDLIKTNNNIIEYLNTRNLKIIRGLKNYKVRGKEYHFGNENFTICDNEPALFKYMETLEGSFNTIQEQILNQVFPIAFALEEEEANQTRIYTNVGKKSREKGFSNHGWKHCHLLQCSPRNVDLHGLSVNQRMLRLMSPMNHFPFPSPRKYEMAKDWGEDEKLLANVKYYLFHSFYKEDQYKKEFINFLNLAGDQQEIITSPYEIKLTIESLGNEVEGALKIKPNGTGEKLIFGGFGVRYVGESGDQLFEVSIKISEDAMIFIIDAPKELVGGMNVKGSDMSSNNYSSSNWGQILNNRSIKVPKKSFVTLRQLYEAGKITHDSDLPIFIQSNGTGDTFTII